MAVLATLCFSAFLYPPIHATFIGAITPKLIGPSLLFLFCQTLAMCVFINKKTDLHTSNFNGNSPFHQAYRDDNIAAVNAIAEQGTDVNGGKQYGETPLHLASYNGKTEIVHFLIEKGADVNAVNQWPRDTSSYSNHWWPYCISKDYRKRSGYRRSESKRRDTARSSIKAKINQILNETAEKKAHFTHHS